MFQNGIPMSVYNVEKMKCNLNQTYRSILPDHCAHMLVNYQGNTLLELKLILEKYVQLGNKLQHVHISDLENLQELNKELRLGLCVLKYGIDYYEIVNIIDLYYNDLEKVDCKNVNEAAEYYSFRTRKMIEDIRIRATDTSNLAAEYSHRILIERIQEYAISFCKEFNDFKDKTRKEIISNIEYNAWCPDLSKQFEEGKTIDEILQNTAETTGLRIKTMHDNLRKFMSNFLKEINEVSDKAYKFQMELIYSMISDIEKTINLVLEFFRNFGKKSLRNINEIKEAYIKVDSVLLPKLETSFVNIYDIITVPKLEPYTVLLVFFSIAAYCFIVGLLSKYVPKVHIYKKFDVKNSVFRFLASMLCLIVITARVIAYFYGANRNKVYVGIMIAIDAFLLLFFTMTHTWIALLILPAIVIDIIFLVYFMYYQHYEIKEKVAYIIFTKNDLDALTSHFSEDGGHSFEKNQDIAIKAIDIFYRPQDYTIGEKLKLHINSTIPNLIRDAVITYSHFQNLEMKKEIYKSNLLINKDDIFLWTTNRKTISYTYANNNGSVITKNVNITYKTETELNKKIEVIKKKIESSGKQFMTFTK